MTREKKRIRQSLLIDYVKSKPFFTDEELAKLLNVSIQTIRLDRLELGIPELRERVKQLAEATQKKVKSISSSEVSGELLELELGKSGISLMNITEAVSYTHLCVIVRTPLIPTLTATKENIEQISRFISSCYDKVKYELLNYNPLAKAKYSYLDMEYCFNENPKLYTNEQMEQFYAIAQTHGIQQFIKE